MKIWRGCPNIRFNPATFLCLSQARTWISNVICLGEWKVTVFLVNIGEILYQHRQLSFHNKFFLWSYRISSFVILIDILIDILSFICLRITLRGWGHGRDRIVVVSSNLFHGEVYSMQHYVIKFVIDLRQVNSFLRVLRFPPPIILTTMI